MNLLRSCGDTSLLLQPFGLPILGVFEDGEGYKWERMKLCYHGSREGWGMHYSWKDDIDFARRVAGYTAGMGNFGTLSSSLFVASRGITAVEGRGLAIK